jgi:methylated-DNA-[protein]-cysteine S-methyltransferase
MPTDLASTMRYAMFDAPVGVGTLTVLAESDSIVGLRFATHRHEPWSIEADWTRDDADPLLREAAAQLVAYFEDRKPTFDLPLAPAGTAFQRRVWDELRKIPFGQTISYGELARRVGDANASRAVGMANGRNPIAIVIPCHRVIGSTGTLTGFGGGVEVKRALLRHEGLML